MARLGCMMQARAERTVPRVAVPWKTGGAREPREFTLDKAALLELPRARGWRVECLSGRAWLTIDGELQDIVLEAGEVLTLVRQAPVFVSGLPQATVRVHRR